MIVQTIISRLREARRGDIDPYTGHALHDAEAALLELESDNARLVGANLALQARERPSEVVCEFAGWLSESGEDVHEMSNMEIVALVERFFDDRPGPCPDCGGKGGTLGNGIHYCNCEDA